MAEPTLLHVLGTARSGTTMLGFMLGASPDATYLGEVHARFRPFYDYHDAVNCSCGGRECNVWQGRNQRGWRHVHAAASKEAPVVVDASKSLPWVIDTSRQASKQGMRVVHVLTYKRPIDLAYSYQKRSFPWRLALEHQFHYHRRVLEMGHPFVSVRLDQLLATPDAVLERLAGAVGMRYEPIMARFWEADHHAAYGSLRPAVQARDGKGALEEEARPAWFEAMRPDIEAGIAAHGPLARIMAQVEARDVAHGAPEDRPFRRPPPKLWEVKARTHRRWRGIKRGDGGGGKPYEPDEASSASDASDASDAP